LHALTYYKHELFTTLNIDLFGESKQLKLTQTKQTLPKTVTIILKKQTVIYILIQPLEPSTYLRYSFSVLVKAGNYHELQ